MYVIVLYICPICVFLCVCFIVFVKIQFTAISLGWEEKRGWDRVLVPSDMLLKGLGLGLGLDMRCV